MLEPTVRVVPVGRLHLSDRATKFPAIRVPRYLPDTITLEKQAAVPERIPWERRGAFLVAAREALGLSEVRAINLDDYVDGRLLVGLSIQSPRLDAPMVDWTKNNSAEWRELWFAPLLEWIEWWIAQATPEKRLRGEIALFWNLHRPGTPRSAGHRTLLSASGTVHGRLPACPSSRSRRAPGTRS